MCIPEVPPHLLEHIFFQLSEATLHSCKLVCTTWSSIIEKEDFLLRYRANSYHVLISTPDALYTWDGNQQVNTNYNKKKLTRAAFLIGSCRGLVCLNGLRSNRIHIWNPTTGRDCSIPFLYLPKDNKKFVDIGWIYGFGYDGCHYQVMAGCRRSGAALYQWDIQIYSSGYNSWFPCASPSVLVTQVLGTNPLNADYVDGCLYWAPNTHEGRIAYFCLKDGLASVFQSIQLPDNGSHPFMFGRMSSLDRLPAICGSGIGLNDPIRIWRLERNFTWIPLFDIPRALVHGDRFPYCMQLPFCTRQYPTLSSAEGRDLMVALCYPPGGLIITTFVNRDESSQHLEIDQEVQALAYRKTNLLPSWMDS